VKDFFYGLKTELKALVVLIVLPALSLLLPWTRCNKLFWKIARLNWLYSDRVDLAYEKASIYIKRPEPESWKRKARYHLLVENSDYFLTLSKGSKGRDKYLEIKGDSLVGQSRDVLFVTFHWGQGFWALDYLKSEGFRPAWLYLPVEESPAWGNIMANIMGRLRVKQVERLAGVPPIATGNSIAKMKRRLKSERDAVLAMPDAPIKNKGSSIPVKLLDEEARLPAGVIRMAAEEQLDVYAYTIRVNAYSGKRVMQIHGPLLYENVGKLAQSLATLLESAIKDDSAAWYMWPYVDSFFSTDC